MVVRRDSTGRAVRPGEGEQIQIGGNDVYVALCRRHWRAEVGDTPPVLPSKGVRPAVGKAHPGEATPPAAGKARPGAVDLMGSPEEGTMLAVACDEQDGGSESPK